MILAAADTVRPGLYVGPAFADDLDAIGALLDAARGDCLPLTRHELLRRLGEFQVARAPSGRVIGCCAVRAADAAERAELRCVAVDPRWRRTGLGRLLVQRATERANLAGEDLYCVSRKPEFFEGLGFSRLPASEVPQRNGAAAFGPPRCALVHRRPTHPGAPQ